jgi:hypothetical protein
MVFQKKETASEAAMHDKHIAFMDRIVAHVTSLQEMRMLLLDE